MISASLSCVEDFGGEYVMTRKDHVSGSDRLAEAAEILKISEHDVVVNIQGDQPLFPAEVVEQVAQPLLDDLRCRCLLSSIKL